MVHGYNLTGIAANAMVIFATCLAASAQTPRTVWIGEKVNLLGTPSRDGNWLSFVDQGTGNLAVRNLSTGLVKFLTANPSNSKEFAYFSTISPDGQQVAYAWFNTQGFYDLRVTPFGGKSKILFQNEESGFVQPCAWTPDGKHILTLFFRKDNISQIALVPVSGGPPRILKSLNWVYPKKMDISPNGKFIVYDTFTKNGGPDRALFVLASDGSTETRLTESAGSQLFPLWSPDGKFVYYASETWSGMAIQRIRFPSGKPESVAANLGRFLPLGITVAGEMLFGSRSGGIDILAGSTTQLNKAQLVSKSFPGLNSHPAFSSDGEQLAYLSRRGTENFGQESRVIIVRDSTGNEKEVPSRMAHLEAVRWSPDGSSLLVSGSDRNGRAGLFRIKSDSNENQNPVPVAIDEAGSFRGMPGVWTDSAVVYIKNGQELRRRPFNKEPDQLLYNAPTAGILYGVSVSKDGSVIAVGYANGFVGIRRNGQMSLRKTPLNRVTEVVLTNTAVFVSNGSETWKLPLDIGEPQKIGLISGIDVTPDEAKLAFTIGSFETSVLALKLNLTPPH